MSDAGFLLQCDPGASYRALRDEIDAAVSRVLGSGAYILGREVEAFEAEFAGWTGARRAVTCASGTDALVLALRAFGVGAGDLVATVSHTAVATVAAIELVGATPVLLDVDPRTFTLDPSELAEVLAGSAPVRAVVPVHLYGHPAAMREILDLATGAGAIVIEDCAQAPGAAIDGVAAGCWGAAGAFSFYPTKNLGAFGDGGAVVTGDVGAAERLGKLRQYGWGSQRSSEIAGINSRLDEIQAAILRVKLARLTADNARRRTIAAAYDAALADAEATPPTTAAGCEHAFHQYVVRSADRDSTQARLRAAGIGTAIHYPLPVHLQPAYRGRVRLGPAGCAETERLCGEILSLPMHAHLRDEDVSRVCDALRGVRGRRAAE